MALLLRKNFARGVLLVGMSNLDTQLTITPGHTLPTSVGNFMLVIWNEVGFPDPANDPFLEIVKASYSGTPNVYNIVRAQEGTLAVVHSSGDRAALHYTAGMSQNDLDVHTHAASAIISGTFANARIAQSNIIQHQGAIDHNSLLNVHQNVNIGASPTLAGLTLTGYTGIVIAVNGVLTASNILDLGFSN